MDNKSYYSSSHLQHWSYRQLQKLAKSMNLPSNVKKVYLVEMIVAKKFAPESEVQQIIRRVMQERKHAKTAKKMSRLAVDSSSNESMSPAISDTPKRPPCMLRCSELRHQMMRTQNSEVSSTSQSHPSSDRVLRSCNVNLKQHKFVEINQCHMDMVEQAAQMSGLVIHKYNHNVLPDNMRQGPFIEISTHDVDVADQATQVNRVIEKYKPNILSNKERQIAPVTQMSSTQIVVQRQRQLGGICPIAKELVPARGLRVRNREGKMSTLSAFIHKPHVDSYTSTRSNNNLKRKLELTVQDVINGNVEPATSHNYPNTSLAGNIEMTLQDVFDGNVEPATSHNYPNTSLARNIEMTLQDVFDGNVEPATSHNYPNTSLARNIEMTLQDAINGNVEPATSHNYPNTSLARNIEMTLQDVFDGNVEPATSHNYPNTSLARNIEMTMQDVINGNVEPATSHNCPNTSLARNIEMTMQDVINGNVEPATSHNCRNTSLARNIEMTLQDVINGNVEPATSHNYPNTSLTRNIEMTLQDVFDGNVEPATSHNYPNTSLTHNVEMMLQDVINRNVELATSSDYPNTSAVEDVPDFTKETPATTSSVYYHKKIRAEQVRERRSTLNERCELPPITEAFGHFQGNHVQNDVTQPLYVQVSEESERILNYPQLAQHNTSLLETLYNFKNQFVINQPLLQLATTTNTTCVYSTPTMATAAPQKPDVTSYMEPYPAYPIKSSPSIGTALSQDLGANVTICEMVEDALELISQDGDYMERMGMHIKMQCVLCDWAGPKLMLEHHIRKDHVNEIDQQEKREWNISYSLGSVHQQLWKSRVIQHELTLYVLSVKCNPPGRLLATLTTVAADTEITTASLTVFNTVTGEPHSWNGKIQELPPSLPYDNQPGLQLDLASLDLIPNSANLKFVNGELVLQSSPSKVVFGQVELNDIHIIVFVKIS